MRKCAILVAGLSLCQRELAERRSRRQTQASISDDEDYIERFVSSSFVWVFARGPRVFSSMSQLKYVP